MCETDQFTKCHSCGASIITPIEGYSERILFAREHDKCGPHKTGFFAEEDYK